MKNDQSVWSGEVSRPVQVHRPCSCGCDTRDGQHEGWAGYLTGSDERGHGFTVWIADEQVYATIEEVLNRA